MRRRSGFRGWAIVWAVLQFALPAAATLADARLQRDAASAERTHVESRSDAACRPLHPEECALCQLVSRSSAPMHDAATCPASLRVVDAPAIDGVPQRALDGEAWQTRARAPPLG